jgi:hypothetical protein
MIIVSGGVDWPWRVKFSLDDKSSTSCTWDLAFSMSRNKTLLLGLRINTGSASIVLNHWNHLPLYFLSATASNVIIRHELAIR